MITPTHMILSALTASAIGLAIPDWSQSAEPCAVPWASHTYGYGYHGLGGIFSTPYAMGRIPTPPYFMLHPPVYYSYPVARPYGYSPFAYPGTFRTPETTEPMPQNVTNPTLPPKVTVSILVVHIPEKMQCPCHSHHNVNTIKIRPPYLHIEEAQGLKT